MDFGLVQIGTEIPKAYQRDSFRMLIPGSEKSGELFIAFVLVIPRRRVIGGPFEKRRIGQAESYDPKPAIDLQDSCVFKRWNWTERRWNPVTGSRSSGCHGEGPGKSRNFKILEIIYVGSLSRL
jgi:hypothetical protein